MGFDTNYLYRLIVNLSKRTKELEDQKESDVQGYSKKDGIIRENPVTRTFEELGFLPGHPGVPSGIETTPQGGKQSEIPVRLDLLDATAIIILGKVLKLGENRYGKENWHKISLMRHVNSALNHLMLFLKGEETLDREGLVEDHLAHAFCRLMFALSPNLVQEEEANETTHSESDSIQGQGALDIHGSVQTGQEGKSPH